MPPLGIELHAQTGSEYCAPACAQMILSLRGYRNETPDGTWQYDLEFAIVHAPVASVVPLGDPLAVAYIVRKPPASPCPPIIIPQPLNDYAAIRKQTPDEACAAVAYALTHSEPSAVLVLAGGHWVVIHGGEGQGTLGDPDFRIDSFWMCNPDNGFYQGIPGDGPTPTCENYIEECVCYADFVNTYFTPATYYSDCQYAVVTDANATTQPFEAQPCPKPSESNSIEDAIEAILRTPAGAPLEGLIRQRHRRVKRLDREDESYYLVPFLRDDGCANVLRLDEHGRHLGTALRLPYVNLHQDVGALKLLLHAFPRFAPGSGGLHPEMTLVWHPSRESTSPYNPFYRIKGSGEYAYVSLGGRSDTHLHELRSGEAFDPSSRQ